MSELVFKQKKPWENNSNSIWLASTIGLHRNIDKFKFPIKMDGERRKQVIALVGDELLSDRLLNQPFLIKAEELNPLEKGYLSEHFLANQNFNQAHMGEAFVLDQSGEFLASLNLRDHLHLQLVDIKGDLETVWNRLVKIETKIGKKVSFSFSPKFGFLTSDFNQCGTGLIVGAYLQLPALIHTDKIEEVLEKNDDESIWITGIHGDPTEIIGDILVIQNNYTLGVTEENIISAVRSYVTKLMIEENSARNDIRHSQSPDIKDKVSRAYAILIHSYHIEAIEALNAISLLKLGAEMEWIQGISLAELNQLFFNCRRSHLLSFCSKKIQQDEIIHKRAEFIHKALKDVQLKI